MLLQRNLLLLALLVSWVIIDISGASVTSDQQTKNDSNIKSSGSNRNRRTTNTEPCTGESCPDSSITATEALAQQDYEALCASGQGSSSTMLRGRDGRDGRDGREGDDGQDGQPGERGVSGEKGEKGDTGSPGRDIPDPGTVGSTYVRWGRRTCPSTATLVYEGMAAGDYFLHAGGGSNFVCLPYDPDYLQIEVGEQGHAVIYTTEYQLAGFPPLSNLQDHDVPCAVCRVTRRGTVLMIPAKIVCPSDWTEEYQGYLMTEHYGHKSSKDYICVDENAEARSDSNPASQDAALLYTVEGRCTVGNLPCRPYITGDELTCVVCTI